MSARLQAHLAGYFSFEWQILNIESYLYAEQEIEAQQCPNRMDRI
jgi:hypothetical protein